MDLTVPWTVEFTKIDALPGAQHEAALVENQGFGSGNITGHDVRRGIAFHMLKIAFMGNFLPEKSFHIGGHIGIGILIDGNRGSGMWGENKNNTVLHT